MRRLVLALSLLLAACGPNEARAPFADSRIPPSLSPRFYPPEGWAWGLVKVGEAPAQRYGVATTRAAPRTHLLILTGHGELAEAWFETVSDLNGRGYTVWVLERAGQGGSGRLSPLRDLVHAPSFDPDVAAVRAMAGTVIRPGAGEPLIVLGHGIGALVALRAVQDGLAADGLILSSPVLEGGADHAVWARRLGLGWLRAPGGDGWAREGPDGFARGLTGDRRRGAVQHAWQVANPDLRMGGPSLSWTAALAQSADAARGRLAHVAQPVLMLAAEDDATSAAACDALPRCVRHELEGARPALHLERDAVRRPWIEAIDVFARTRIAAGRAAAPE